MLAVVIHKFGPPSDLKIEQVPTPTPGKDEVLIQIKAASINPSDIKNIQGVMHGTTLPRIPGRDFAGIITAGPANLIGKEVFGTGGDTGFTRDGSHAQYILLPTTAITPKPQSLTMDQAALAGVTYVTAYSALITAAKLTKDDTILIIGASGGVGSAAVQIAAWHQAKILAAIRNDTDAPAAKQNGATQIINTSTTKLPDAVKSLTNGQGPTIIFDTTGSLFPDSIEMAAVGARIPIITASKDGQTTFNLRTIYRKLLTITGIDSRPLDATASAKFLTQMLPAFESGKFKVAPGKVYPLTQAVEAYEQAGRGGARILLRPGDVKPNS